MKILYIDTCRRDYFAGHHLPWFNILIDNTATYADIKEAMLDSECMEHLELWEDERFNDQDFAKAVEVCFSGVKDMDKVIEPGLEIEDIDTWDCYIYFAIDLENEDV